MQVGADHIASKGGAGQRKREKKTLEAPTPLEMARPGGGIILVGEAGAVLRPKQDVDPYQSKIGGRVAYLESGSLSRDQLSPCCAICKRQLYLVAQVYAPVKGPRVLYIFGCNRHSCRNRPGSWRVLRSQKAQEEEQEQASAGPTVASPSPPSQEATTGWGEDNGDRSGGGGWGEEEEEGGAAGCGDDWDASSLVEEPADDYLEALLRSRDETLQKKEGSGGASSSSCPARTTKKAQQETPRSTTTNGESRSGHGDGFGGPARQQGGSGVVESGPAFLPGYEVVDVVEADRKGGGRWKGGTREDEYYSDDAIKARLSRYWEEEEDKDLVELLKHKCRAGSGSGGGGDDDGHVERRMESVVTKGTGGYDAEAYESASPAEKAFLRFQERVSLHPRQVLRYAYGGTPLWSTHRPPKEEPPMCACGHPRRFELQLMPMLLAILRVDHHEGDEDHPAQQSPPPPPPLRSPKTEEDAVDSIGMVEGRGGPSASNGCRLKDDDRTNVHDEEDGGSGGGGASTAAAAAEEEEEERTLRSHSDEEADDVDVKRVLMGQKWRRRVLESGGMDWGVVTVWSCEESCDESVEEVVIVQDARDDDDGDDQQQSSSLGGGAGARHQKPAGRRK